MTHISRILTLVERSTATPLHSFHPAQDKLIDDRTIGSLSVSLMLRTASHAKGHLERIYQGDKEGVRIAGAQQ